MPSRHAAVRSLIQLTYQALQLEQPLTAAAYQALLEQQENWAWVHADLTHSNLIDVIEATLLTHWSDLMILETQAQESAVRSRLASFTPMVLAALPDAAAAEPTTQPQLPPIAHNTVMLLVGMAIAAGVWGVGQRVRDVWAGDRAAVTDSVGGAEGDRLPPTANALVAPSLGPLGIEASVWQQLQISYAQIRGHQWPQLTAAEQEELTQELVAQLQTLPPDLPAKIGHYTEATTRPLLTPPASCRVSAQALYDQTDLALYGLFPDLLSVNIAQTGFDQVWYALLEQQIRTTCA